jgi:hypothetical protein
VLHSKPCRRSSISQSGTLCWQLLHTPLTATIALSVHTTWRLTELQQLRHPAGNSAAMRRTPLGEATFTGSRSLGPMLAGVADGFESSHVLGASCTACTTSSCTTCSFAGAHKGSKQQLPALLCLTQVALLDSHSYLLVVQQLGQSLQLHRELC